MNIRKSLDAVGMYNGNVLTPELANTLNRQQKVKQPSLKGYGLIGWMSQQMHAQIHARANEIGWRLKAFETPGKQMLLIATVQAAQFQARLLAHLADPDVQEMLRWSAQNGHMQLVFGVPGQTKVVRYHPTFYPEDLAPLLALAEESQHLPPLRTLFEFAGAAAELVHKKDKVVCSGMDVAEDVTVTSVLWHRPLTKSGKQEVRTDTVH